jgi:TRAP-type mannitol/chloroaromatic compound transport system permease small subunit
MTKRGDAMSSWVRVASGVSILNRRVGEWVSYLNMVIMLIVVWEVFCRYVIESPTTWAMEMNQYFLAALALLAGGYALLDDRHVRVDILYRRFSPKAQAWVEILTVLVLVAFCAILVWHGTEFALDALRKGKRSMTLLEFPLFPSMALVPLGGILLALQGLAKLIQNAFFLAGRAIDIGGRPAGH